MGVSLGEISGVSFPACLLMYHHGSVEGFVCSDFWSSFLNLYPSMNWLCLEFTQTVNAKKLEKAEARLKAKQEKRSEKETLKTSNPL